MPLGRSRRRLCSQGMTLMSASSIITNVFPPPKNKFIGILFSTVDGDLFYISLLAEVKAGT